jgi:hypothetical protein
MAGKPLRNRVGAFSAQSAMLKVDGRTAEAKLLRETDADLVEMYGGQQQCTPARLYLIEATSLLRLRVCALRSRVAAGAEMPDHTDKAVSALSGALRANLLALGLDGAAAPEMTLERYIELKVAGK